MKNLTVTMNKILKTNNYCKNVKPFLNISVYVIVNPLRHFLRARTWIALRGLGGEGITIHTPD